MMANYERRVYSGSDSMNLGQEIFYTCRQRGIISVVDIAHTLLSTVIVKLSAESNILAN